MATAAEIFTHSGMAACLVTSISLAAMSARLMTPMVRVARTGTVCGDHLGDLVEGDQLVVAVALVDQCGGELSSASASVKPLRAGG